MMVVNLRLEELLLHSKSRKLVCFQAPGGFGKTTAAEWWVEQLGLPSIWLCMENLPGLRHVPTFQSHLVTKFAPNPSGLGEGGVQTGDVVEAIQSHFPSGASIVIDDYHLVKTKELDQCLSDLLLQTPENVHLIITTRTAPELPVLPKLLVRRQAVIITDQDLHLETSEIAKYLDLPEETAARIFERTHGWFFALNLLADAGRQGIAITGYETQPHLESYLFQEILASYPEYLSLFMQVTALLGSFTLEDCEKLGLPDAPKSLQRLERDRLFLQRSGDKFHYHALIKQLLAERLTPSERRQWDLKIARFLFERENENCLAHFIAAQAWPEASRAVTHFHVTRWREYNEHKPTLDYWFAQIPGHALQEDPWGILLYVFRQDTELGSTDRLAMNQRAIDLFAANGDQGGEALALYNRAKLLQVDGQHEAYIQLVPRIEDAQERFPDGHPLSLIGLGILADFYLDIRPNREKWEAKLGELLGHPPVTPLLSALHFHNHLLATARYLDLGEFETAVSHWRQAVRLLKQARTGRCIPAGKQAALACLTELTPELDSGAIRNIFDSERDDHYLNVMITFYEAMDAWQHEDWGRAEKAFVATLDLEKLEPHLYLAEYYTEARLRLGAIRQRQRELDQALALYLQAKALDRSSNMAGEVAWHLAWGHHAAGKHGDARAFLTDAEDFARQKDHKFLLAKALLLRAMISGVPPFDEAQELVKHWRYEHALRFHFPEALAIMAGDPPPPTDPHPPRIRIYTLGGLRVEVDGQPVTWKRSNSQIILLDLLCHPEGSTAEEMENRYWRTTGNSSFRNDMQALRQALESDKPGRESSFVRLEGRRYRWTTDPTNYWWDAQELTVLVADAVSAENDTLRASAVRKANELYKGDFVPEFAPSQAIAQKRLALRQAFERLKNFNTTSL